MPVDKIQFRPGPLGEMIERRSNEGGENEKARQMTQRYLYLVQESLPDLTEEELQSIVAVFNGTLFEVPESIRWLPMSLEDAPEDHYFGRFGVDKQALVEKAKSWTLAERAAVIDFVERFWHEDENYSIDEALETTTPHR